MKIQYINKRFQAKSLELLERANNIIDDYQARGYDLTLRQLYYQLVARDIIPNSEKSYKKLGQLITNARDAGLVDWFAIIDRTRGISGLQTWDNPAQIVKAAIDSYRADKWENQEYRVFVWVEKEALSGVISSACGDEGIQVDYMACRGYMSASAIWRQAQKCARLSRQGQTPVVIHLGDHDPSGIDMTRDNIERLELYSGLRDGIDLQIVRLALNMDQVREYDPPPNPAKLQDSRAGNYVANYGYDSWELDSLDPDVLVDMIQEEILRWRDEDLWQEAVGAEDYDKMRLREMLEDFGE